MHPPARRSCARQTIRLFSSDHLVIITIPVVSVLFASAAPVVRSDMCTVLCTHCTVTLDNGEEQNMVKIQLVKTYKLRTYRQTDRSKT